MTCPACGALLPEPRERFCPGCGADLEAAPPAPPLTRPQSRPGTPWEDRGRIGFVPALVETTQKVLTRPSSFFTSMPVTGGIGGPLLYGLLVGTLGVVVAALYREIFQGLVGAGFAGLRGSSELQRVMPLMMGGVGLVLQVVFAPIVVTVGLFVVTAIIHVILLLLGGAQRGFEATFRVMCYSEAAAVLNIVPLCGNVISAVYFLVLAIIGLGEAHGTGKGRAAAAVLLPLFLLCCCFAVIAALVLGGAAWFLGQMK